MNYEQNISTDFVHSISGQNFKLKPEYANTQENKDSR